MLKSISLYSKDNSFYAHEKNVNLLPMEMKLTKFRCINHEYLYGA